MFDPLQYPGRLEDFLSLCLREEVKILSALPTESSRLTDEGFLLVIPWSVPSAARRTVPFPNWTFSRNIL